VLSLHKASSVVLSLHKAPSVVLSLHKAPSVVLYLHKAPSVVLSPLKLTEPIFCGHTCKNEINSKLTV
jgi:hypothetical protein